MKEQEIVNLLKKEKKEKKKNEQAILSALNIYEQLNVHEQTHKTKEKPTKIYTGINSNGFADIIYVEKPKKKQFKLKVNDLEETLIKPKYIKKKKKNQKIKYALVNAALKEQKE